MPTDEFCGICHQPTGREYGSSIPGAHQVDYKSTQLLGVLVDIIDVSNTGPGQRPIVTFALSNKWGPLPPSFLERMRFTLSGPNDDFTFYVREESINDLVADGPNWKYQFEAALPNDAVGSYSLGFEGRINPWTINPGTDDEFTMRDPAQNYTVPFAVTADLAAPRRVVVDDAKCENCHANVSFHGTNRHNATEYCQTCHMPSATDRQGSQSIDFRYMVHKIHRGEDLENGYIVGGTDDFSDVVFPGDLRNCDSCHVDDSYALPLPANLEFVVTPADPITLMGPTTAACLSCHDSSSAAVHASTNSNDLGEACASCHGTGKTYDVEKVHAR
jgi:OmcA/MtrC family decaheme c-type cytochrome